MKFVVDEQLPRKLVLGLRSKGYEAIHVEDIHSLGENPKKYAFLLEILRGSKTVKLLHIPHTAAHFEVRSQLKYQISERLAR